MKILYAIQGTGNGHLSRALEFIPALRDRPGVELDILLSGYASELDLPCDVAYNLRGAGFAFGRKGGIDWWTTWRKASVRNFIREARALPVGRYDLVINDFEPVSAWAAYLRGVPCVSLSHQWAIYHPDAPKPQRRYPLAARFLRWYAPCRSGVGFHYQPYGEGLLYPVVKQNIRATPVSDRGHYTVYLPAVGEDILVKTLSAFPEVTFQVFSKRCQAAYAEGNVHFFPVAERPFIESMASSRGVLCGAGFETPSEALFMGKKLCAVPMRHQFEQDCNAAALRELGVAVLPDFGPRRIPELRRFLAAEPLPPMPFPDQTELAINRVLASVETEAVGRPVLQGAG